MNGAACITALRMVAHRIGVIDRMPPQMLEEQLLERSAISPDSIAHHVIDHALHFAIGGTGGAVYGSLVRRGRGSVLPGAALTVVELATQRRPGALPQVQQHRLRTG